MYLPLVYALIFITGCGNDVDDQKAGDIEAVEAREIPTEAALSITEPDNKSTGNVTQESDSNNAENILDQGFYAETLTDTSRVDGTPDNTHGSAEAEAPLVTSDQKSVPNNRKPSSLIKGFGFSGAETNPIETQEKAKVEKPYCLSEQAQTEELPAAICERISTRLSSVTLDACKAARLAPTGCTSVKKFPILLREFAPIDGKTPKGRILIIGGTHGDELTSVSVSLRWIEKLNQHHSGLYHWHIAPLMNPDGVLKRVASRTNQNSVDLNRNMPSDDWPEKALKYWTKKGGKDPRKFPGEHAASEPETQWLIDEINTFKPDAIISVHAPYGVVDFDSLLLNTAPKSLGKLHLNLLGTYPGSLGNFTGINLNIPVITLELPHSWIMPTEKETNKIWEGIVSWLKININFDVVSNSEQ